jgi:hypothetical protein
MGYDPDECPKQLMDQALELDRQMGTAALSELAPVYGKSQARLTVIKEIAESRGLVGRPSAPRRPHGAPVPQGVHWQRGVAAARELRQTLGKRHDMIATAYLCELLGLNEHEVEQWSPVKRNNAAIAVPEDGDQFKFIPRKKHPISKRFELARFLGDYLMTDHTNGQWLASTDLSTSRQKYQRAFAAEFLCPIAQLEEFLQGDYSESAIEDAGEHFQVSTRAVNSLLVNNGLIQHSLFFDYADAALPYRLGI